MSYTYKVWVAQGKEHFEYGSEQIKKKEFPFEESLMKLLYFDMRSLDEVFEGMCKTLDQLYETKEQQYADALLAALDLVAKKHIFFEQLRLDWHERIARAKAQNYGDIAALLPRTYLSQLPLRICVIQEQIKEICAQVLGLDTSGTGAVQKKMVDYYNANGHDTMNTFQFHPQRISFEIIDRKTFTEALYPNDIYDIIDYFVREGVKHEQPIRVCKNCGRYFVITGRISAEYCDRPIEGKVNTCKKMGSINQWKEKHKDDEVFQVYRREYKKRFGWIKAGKIKQDDFYAWSEQARKEKAKCVAGEISLQELVQWLRNS